VPQSPSAPRRSEMGAAPIDRETLPDWASELRDKYLAGEASTFVLYRNVFDVVLHQGQLLDLKSFVADVLVGGTKQTVVEISAEFGVVATKGEVLLPEQGDLIDKLHALEAQLRAKHGIGLIVPYADLLMPGEGGGFLSTQERLVSTVFHRWSLDRRMMGADNITILITESLGALDTALLNSPKVSAIEVPMPDAATRAALLRHLGARLSEAQLALYADRMAGLRGVQIEGLMKASGGHGIAEPERAALILALLGDAPDAAERAQRFASITAGMTKWEIVKLIRPTLEGPSGDMDEDVLRLIQARKRELIEKECDGLIEFVEPKHGLSAVGGAEHIKGELAQIAKSLREGDSALSPMGLLAVGPMGAGKTFVIKAFLKEAGLSAVALKNFRSKWVGSTERNLERVLATVKAMGPIAVLIDEGDRSFGKDGGEGGDDGTSSRVIARLKEFMSDTENRGRVLFLLLTNRPDKLDTDIKRPGRLDRKIPFFYCETAAERAQVMRAVLGRHVAAGHPVGLDELVTLCETLSGYSNADLEAVALLGLEFARRREGLLLNDALLAARDDFIPPRERDMIDFMELLAVSETSRRSLLPQRFQQLSVQDIQSQLAQARARALAR
jgi:transitional endoplasmic reticulum ATPase